LNDHPHLGFLALFLSVRVPTVILWIHLFKIQIGFSYEDRVKSEIDSPHSHFNFVLCSQI